MQISLYVWRRLKKKKWTQARDQSCWPQPTTLRLVLLSFRPPGCPHSFYPPHSFCSPMIHHETFCLWVPTGSPMPLIQSVIFLRVQRQSRFNLHLHVFNRRSIQFVQMTFCLYVLLLCDTLDFCVAFPKKTYRHAQSTLV